LKQPFQQRIETVGMGVAGYEGHWRGRAASFAPAQHLISGFPKQLLGLLIPELKPWRSPASTGKSWRILSQKAWIVCILSPPVFPAPCEKPPRLGNVWGSHRSHLDERWWCGVGNANHAPLMQAVGHLLGRSLRKVRQRIDMGSTPEAWAVTGPQHMGFAGSHWR
jgi:hypothetical protein